MAAGGNGDDDVDPDGGRERCETELTQSSDDDRGSGPRLPLVVPAPAPARRVTFETVHCAVLGLALGNAGLAATFVIAEKFHEDLFVRVHVDSISGVRCLAPIAVTLLMLYFLKMVTCHKGFLADLEKPHLAAAMGAGAMALSLLSSFLALIDGDTKRLTEAAIIFSALVQFLANGWFISLCYRLRSPPEPYWNTGVMSVVMTAITGVAAREAIPGWFRHATLSLGLVGLVTTLPPQVFSVFSWLMRKKGHDPLPPAANNNPSVAIMQAAASIACSGWHASPLIEPGAPGNSEIGHFLFALSTLFFVLTLVALWHRRRALRTAIISRSPGLAALTFPFVITCNAALLYFGQHGGRFLVIWTGLLLSLSTALVGAVDLVFFWIFAVDGILLTTE